MCALVYKSPFKLLNGLYASHCGAVDRPLGPHDAWLAHGDVTL